MPACACQHFQAGKKAAPGPPPLGELMRQGAEGGGGVEGGNSRGLVTQSLRGSDRRERLRPIQNAALAPWRRAACHTKTHTHNLSIPISAWCTRPVRSGVSEYLSAGKTACPRCCCHVCQRGGRERGRESSGQTDSTLELCGGHLLTACCFNNNLMWYSLSSV